MWLSVVVSSLCFLAGAAGFWFLYRNDWPIILAIPVLLFLVGYSLMKRYTRLCHYYLGAALALAPLCAWLAVAGRIGLPPLLMAGAVVLWTAGFDILYACQDYAFDVQTGLFSIPARIGIAPALWVSRLSHLLCVALLIALDATTPELGLLFALGIGLATVLLIVEHSLVKPNDLSRLNLAFFTLNGVISLLLGGLGVCDVVLSHRQGADLAREFNAKVERRMLPTPICSEMQSQTPFRRPGLAGVISRNPQGTPGGDRGAALLLQPSAPLKEYLSGRG
jgi:4-hydroxybenzoate polyprenyltransferase